MSEEEKRAKFEAAYAAQFGRKPQNWDAVLGKYLDAHGQGSWWAWQAALASVVVELPEGLTLTERCADAWRPEPDHERLISRQEAVAAIEAAGATIKGATAGEADPNPSQRKMQPIPIAAAERIAKDYGYDQVIVVARRVGDDPDPHGEHVTTYGISKAHCSVAARIGDFLKYKFMGWAKDEASGEQVKP